MPSPLSHLRIILVEPAGALNVGSVARVMKNMGLQHLVLVNPQCDPLGDEARQMAVHAAEILETAQQVPTLVAALTGCQRIMATTGLDGTTLNVTLEHPRMALPWLVSPIAAEPLPAALIFGREDRGLTRAELNYAQRFVRIPTSPTYSSLNLAQAVAICCYELAVWVEQEREAAGAQSQALPSQALSGQALSGQALPISQERSIDLTPGDLIPGDLVPFEALEGYYQQLEALLLQIGYLWPHTAASRMEKFRRLFSKAQLSPAEVAMLRGILSQMQWALQNAPQRPNP